MNMRLRIEIAHDPESNNWSYRVPSLGIVGGEDSREAAEAAALEAITFTLESDSNAPAPPGGEVEYLRIDVGPLEGAA
jgi:hypothetical protein